MVGGSGFQRPIELATLRLRNMSEVLSHWKIYVPNANYLTQRGGTFLIDTQGQVLYEHRDRGILGFAENMSRPLSFLASVTNIELQVITASNDSDRADWLMRVLIDCDRYATSMITMTAFYGIPQRKVAIDKSKHQIP